MKKEDAIIIIKFCRTIWAKHPHAAPETFDKHDPFDLFRDIFKS